MDVYQLHFRRPPSIFIEDCRVLKEAFPDFRM